MSDPTPAEIDAQRENAELRQRLTRLEAEWERAKQHGLGDLLAVSGSMRFGGNTMMFGPMGLEFKVSSGSVIYFLTDFSTSPSTQYPRTQLLGTTDSTIAEVTLDSLATAARHAYVQPTGRTTQESVDVAAIWDSTIARLYAFANATDSYVAVQNSPFAWPSDTSDLSALAGGDGRTQYRSDTDEYRGRANGATDTFAMRGWVTAGFVAAGLVLGAYKDADQEVTTATLATDSELSVTLATSSKYQFSAYLYVLNDGATEGYKAAVTGTVGIQDLKAQIEIYDDTLNTIVGFARITAIDTAVGAALSSGSNFASIRGTIETTTAGTFAISFAQNAAGASAGVHHEVGCAWKVVKVE